MRIVLSAADINLFNPQSNPRGKSIFINISILQMENQATGRVGIQNKAAPVPESLAYILCNTDSEIYSLSTFWKNIIRPLMNYPFHFDDSRLSWKLCTEVRGCEENTCLSGCTLNPGLIKV